MLIPVGEAYSADGKNIIREFLGSEMTSEVYAYLFAAAICQSTQRLTITKVGLVNRMDNATVPVDRALFKKRATEIVEALSSMKPKAIIIEGVRIQVKFTFEIQVPDYDGQEARVKYSYPNNGTAGSFLPDQLVHVIETSANSLQTTYHKLRKRMEMQSSMETAVVTAPASGRAPEDVQFARQAADKDHFDTRSDMRYTRAMDIGPDLAKQFLEHNSHNRPLRMRDVKKYAQDMQEGRWVPCLSSIGFFADGTLANGQHRLMAVIESGTVQQFNVEFGHDKENAQYIDAGRTRTFIDRVTLGDSDANDLPNMPRALAACRIIMSHFRSEMQAGADIEAAILQYIEAYKQEFTFIMNIYKPNESPFYAAPIYAAFITAAIAKIDRERLKNAALVLSKFSGRDQCGDENTTVIAKLREDLIKLKENSGVTRNTKILYMTAHSLNAYFTGKKCPRHPEEHPYPFPIWTFDGLQAYDPKNSDR